MITTLEGIIDFAKLSKKKRIVVPAAEDKHILQAVNDASILGLVDISLIGDKEKVLDITYGLKIDISGYEVINEPDADKSIRMAVDMVNRGDADLLMKGMLQTSDLLRAVLDKEKGLRQGNRILSHLVIIEIPKYPKLLFITDVGLNVSPDLKQKVDIIQNAVDVAVTLGNPKPKVAALAALETINPDMQCTLDAAVLSKMAERGQIKNCTVDGPLAIDNAISREAAEQKGIKGCVAGDADILLVPGIESGNMLYKGLSFLSGFKCMGGVIVGAKVPLVVVSRAESASSKLYSIALATVLGGAE